jgi:5'-deoxynucleotidase YfbR-like HD superfamily hydrolase
VSSAIQTFTGAFVDPLAPDPVALDPLDIAHALSHHCRFGGHSRVFYSVAQHSTVVADAVEARTDDVESTLAALLHDASEAYLGDLPHPLKHRSPLGDAFRQAEQRLQAAIAARFGIPAEPPAVVKEVDRAALAAERYALMLPSSNGHWPELAGVEPLGVEIDPWPSARAAQEFLARFERLQGTRA